MRSIHGVAFYAWLFFFNMIAAGILTFLDARILGVMVMYLSKGCKHEVVFILWFCCYLLLLAVAQEELDITDPTEVEALNAIKKSLIDPNGNLSNWDQGDPCTSSWTGVVCFNKTLVDGFLHVQELQLLNLNLSGTLAPDIGNLAYLEILSFIWNNISGSIPKEIGNIKSLQILLLNGNQLTGALPEELGYLPNLWLLQIDENHISGPIPTSFANLNMTRHFHMNNNSLSGQIPPELSRLPSLIHLLLENNNLSGYLPPELSNMPNLSTLQLDNNNFGGNSIPDTYGNMSKLLKLSLRNCNLKGPIPELSRIPQLLYLDLSSNQLNESIPLNKLSENVTTIILSNNKLTGTIPSYFSGLPHLQRMSLANNSLDGSVPSIIWQNRTLNGTERLSLELENNKFTTISGSIDLPPNITLFLDGNPLCSNSTLDQFCKSEGANDTNDKFPTNSSDSCPTQSCPPPYEYSVHCFCAVPLLIGYRLQTPAFSDFPPYMIRFEEYLTSGLNIHTTQLNLTFRWQVGHRLRINLKIFPVYVDSNSSHTFNGSDVLRIISIFRGLKIPNDDYFGPYELMDLTLLDPYKKDVIDTSSKSGIGTGALVGIILGSIACAVTLSTIVILFILRIRLRYRHAVSKSCHSSKISIDGIKTFTFGELSSATNNFSNSAQVGQGGYGKVYKGILSDGTVVAIKRAQEGSLQGEKEFLTEISILSRLHHRNLVSLIGYCDEEAEQMLVYEFMSNGTLGDHLSVKSEKHLTFAMRLKIALGSAKGLTYLHTEADPPIFHRDVKASNILLDSKFTVKVADFGLSRLAPVADIVGIVPGHVSTTVKGTPGYLDPEYFLTHKLTDKSDVYSLGVVFLELLTGMKPIIHGKNIIREVHAAYRSGVIFSIIDGRMGSYPPEHVEKFLMLALKCCEDKPDARPKMVEVVRELENIWSMMPDSDTKKAEIIAIDSCQDVNTSSSSSAIRTPSESRDMSGSYLVSGVISSIMPR